MKKICKQLAALALALVMLLGLNPCEGVARAAEERPYCYNYVLLARKDGTGDGTVELALYVEVRRSDNGLEDSETPPGPLLDAGAFALRYPEWVTGIRFTPSNLVNLQQIVPEQRHAYPAGEVQLYGEGYHGFSWTGRMENSGHGTIDKGGWVYDANVKAHSLYLGQYTLELPQLSDETGAPVQDWQLPYKTDVGQLDWLTVDEAIAVEVGDTAADGKDALNRTLWNPETKLYQGYYLDPEAEDRDDGVTVTQTDIGFRFNPPKPWPSGKGTLTVVSYDPKKDIEIELYKRDVETGTYSETADYSLTVSGAEAGTGICQQEVQFPEAEFRNTQTDETVLGMNLPAGTYRLVVRKQSHVRAYLTGVTVKRNGTDVELFPEVDGQTLTLPCGDVTGDGTIRQADRAELMRPGRYNRKTENALYDLDGDGRVDQKDLAILTAPANYGKNDFSKGFTENENERGRNGI